MTGTEIIAEAGVNHDGDLGAALSLVRAAARAGADVVKFQTFCADRLATAAAPKAQYQLETTDRSQSQLEMLRALQLPEAAYATLQSECQREGVEFLSSPFDEPSAELLERLGVGRFKIPSGELVNHPLLRRVGASGRPVILSTGMSGLGEVEAALRVLQDAGSGAVVLLHCTSSYPADPGDVNLRAMETLRSAFGVPVGLSDHTLGIEIACAAVALGAAAIEKHFTLDRTRLGPDHRASLEPDELATLVRAARNIERALGDGVKRPARDELQTRGLVRKSVVALHDLAPGTELRAENLGAKRPGTGICPSELGRVLGRRLRWPLARDEIVTWKHLE